MPEMGNIRHPFLVSDNSQKNSIEIVKPFEVTPSVGNPS